MPVFVTGGTGYIGASVVRELVRRGKVVRGLARSVAASEKLRELGAVPVRGELRDKALLLDEAANAGAVVHIAFEQSAEGVAIDRAALEIFVDAMRDQRPLVYTSGVWVYGSRGDVVLDEASALDPLAICAWRPAHEEIVLEAKRLRGVVIRPGVVYGDGGGIVGGMIEGARNAPVRVVGNGMNRWATIRHDALAELFGSVVDTPRARGIYNAVRGASVPYVEVARAAARAGGGDGSIEHIGLEEARTVMGPFADALTADQNVSSQRAERDLGWAPHRPSLLEELGNTTVV